MRGVKMEGDLGDKPHIWGLTKALAIVGLIGAVLLLPGASVSNTGVVPLFPGHGSIHVEAYVKLPKGAITASLARLNPLNENSTAQVMEEFNEPTTTRLKKERVEPSVQFEKRATPREQLHNMIEQVAMRYNVDPALIKAIIMAESGYNPRAVSKKGAIGLMQLMPRTARELGVKELFDPEDNVEAGVRYFKRLLRRFGGDVRLALAAYNAGSTKVRRYRGIPPIGATRYYVRKVFHYYRLYKKESTAQTDDA